MGFFSALFVASAVYASPQQPVPLESIQHFIYTPLVRQATDYTCGVSATQSVLRYYGDEYREDQLVAALKPTKEDGTLTKNIIDFVATQGYQTDAKVGMTIDMLEAAVDQLRPVIVLIQAWPDHPVSDWSQDWDDGHFVVVTGYDNANIYFMDPSSTGNYTFIPKDEFMQRWHDVDGTTRLEKWGLMFFKDKAAYNFHDVLFME